MTAKLLLTLLTLTTAALSQSTSVTSIFFLDDSDSLVASVIGAGPTATTFEISCASDVPAYRCAFPTAATVTAGPSTLHVGWTHSPMALDQVCAITASETASCTATASTSGRGVHTSTVVLSGSDMTRGYMPVTITAGLEKLSAATAKSTVATVTTGKGASLTPVAAAADNTNAAVNNVARGASVAGLAGAVAALIAL